MSINFLCLVYKDGVIFRYIFCMSFFFPCLHPKLSFNFPIIFLVFLPFPCVKTSTIHFTNFFAMVLFEQLALGNLTALGVCFVLLVLVNSIQWKKPSKLDVPLADEGIPLLGHTISFLQDACSLCFKMKDKYGSIYALKIGRTRFNILTDTVSGMLVFLFDCLLEPPLADYCS